MSMVVCTNYETDLTECLASSGTVSIQTSKKFNGNSCVRVNPAGAATGSITQGDFDGTGIPREFSLASCFGKFRFLYDTKAASNWEEFFTTVSTGIITNKLIVGLNSSGNIQVYNKAAVLQATGSRVLDSNTWYSIEFQSTNGVTGAYEIRINGGVEISGTCDQIASNIAALVLGKRTNRNSNSVDYYYDTTIIDDSIFPVAARSVAALYTRAVGPSGNQWTSGTGASDWTQANAAPLDLTKWVMCSTAVGTKRAWFSMDSCATGGITSGSVINGIFVMGGGMRENSTVTSASRVRAKTNLASDIGTSALNMTVTPLTRGTGFQTNPDTAAAWTIAELDALEAGASEANAVSTRLSSTIIYVDYTPPVKQGTGRLFDQAVHRAGYY